jgi:hypothetical protein
MGFAQEIVFSAIHCEDFGVLIRRDVQNLRLAELRVHRCRWDRRMAQP